MITPFPAPQRRRRVNPLGWTLALHTEAAAEEHEDGLAWVRWLFQTVRIRCSRMVFDCATTDRSVWLQEWGQFAGTCFLPTLGPILLNAWSAATEGNEQELIKWDRECSTLLAPEAIEASAAAGAILLSKTEGAKYQGALGRFRQSVARGESTGHAATVWAALAAMFQLPPAEVLAEYLRQEWLVCAAHAGLSWEPQGPLSFSGLTHQALRQCGWAQPGVVARGVAEPAPRQLRHES